ncbi:hypothetical protein [Pseudalkalibacillus berkeleyi]|uniref:Group-specific protein n=1 Tax=Pseudalkalibacillus berkeleyi TaxID=1069813 RepID=A0ABS9H5F8_9BACL|nr:hypothetical protein [Pseudalkalibacillus berkeleyi]MCF6139200.1 hypothetical protein [Pseudalkalibacillus berkeleyi]
MFDPTIFDNLKVSFENYVYDLEDNLSGEVKVTNRVDNMDFATMSREFVLQFKHKDAPDVTMDIVLKTGLKDLSAEILETIGKEPGCTLLVRFYKEVSEVERQCAQIESTLHDIWQQENLPKQTLSTVYGSDQNVYMNTIEVTLDQRINEDQISDIPDLVEHILDSAFQLEIT